MKYQVDLVTSCIPRNVFSPATYNQVRAGFFVGLCLAVLPCVSFAQGTAQSTPTQLKDDEVIKLEDYTVEGALAGQAKAISATKEAPNLINVISSDKMGTFPDLNAAEALRRLPGVSLVLSGGEGRFVSIRGARPQYNGTLVNGFSLPSGDAEIRRNDLVTVSNALIDTIVLTKTATADLPADGIGGTTNIIMRNPLDLRGRQFTLSAYYGYNENGGDAQDREDFSYGDYIGKDKKYAFVVSGNHRLSTYYFTEYSVNQPVLTTMTGGSQAYVPQGFRYQMTEMDRSNLGFDAAFGARLGDSTKLVLRGFKSDHYQDEYVHRYTYSNILPVLSGGVPVDYTAAGGLANTRLIRLWRSRTWWLTIEGVQLTGTTDLHNGIKLDYGAQWARALERYENDLFVNGTNATTPEPIRVLFQNDAIKFFSNTPGATAVLLSPSTQRIGSVSTSSLRKDWESEKTPYLNAQKDFELADGANLQVKTGTYVRLKEKANPNISLTRTATAASTLSFAALGTNGSIDNFDDKGIVLGPKPDPETGKAVFNTNPASFNPPTVGIFPGDVNMFDANEDIYAGYLMGTYTKDRLTLIAGARYEKTDVSYRRLTANVGGFYKEFSDSYNNFLPSAHLKYEILKDMYLRASWANTVGRPDAANIYGVEVIDPVNLRITQPNPGLEALESENFDISVDWYTGPLGQFMVGAFTKDITNFPLVVTDTIPFNGATYTRTSVQAKASGKISGLEVSFRRNLDFLPSFLSGLGVDINYAKLESELQHATRTDSPRLPDQPEHVLNASLYYAYKGFFSRVAMSEEGHILTSVASAPVFDSVRDVYRTWDLTASYEFGREHSYQVFFEWRNITNEHSRTRYNAGGVLGTNTGSGSNIGAGVRFRY